MDALSLRRLAEDGLTGVPQIQDLAAWCWDQADNTGDARFCGLARSLEFVTEAWDAHGAFRGDTMNRLNTAFSRRLPSVLDAPTAEEATHLAKALREELEEVLSVHGF